MSENRRRNVWTAAAVVAIVASRASGAAPPREDLDARVRAFLDRSRNEWRDLNVPYEDGRVLHDLVVNKGFKRGLEIGTSTGHSGTWIAWAMSKTGGKLTTIEIDERRHRKALENF
jgi:caffeoyl-CoA O-methyltransferase